MFTVANVLMLGKRVAGYTLFDSETLAFEERTPRETKQLIQSGDVNGLELDENGEIILASDDFFQNIMLKTGVGRYEPMIPQSNKFKMSDMYSLTQVIATGKDEELVYEVVSNKCARLPLKESTIRSLYSLGCLNGVMIMENTGMIEFGQKVQFILDPDGCDENEKPSVDWDDVAEFFCESPKEDMVAIVMSEETLEKISDEVSDVDSSGESLPESAEPEVAAPKKTTKSKASKAKKKEASTEQ